jgi:hypothetical protein
VHWCTANPALVAAAFLVASCIAEPAPTPVASIPATSEAEDLQQKISRLKDKLREQRDNSGCALPEVVAFDPDRNLTSVTIDKALLDLPGGSPGIPDERTILCHVVEWIDFERLKTFTNRADKHFYLETPGHPTVHAMMGTDGLTRFDGVVRYAMLHLIDGKLVPGVEYTLRPRNEVEGYRWLTVDSLRVGRAD